MILVTISRKLCLASSTTANVVDYEAGAINVDGCRITTNTLSTEGRWPANIVLQHRPNCKHVGTTTVPGYSINRWKDGAKPFGGGAGHAYEQEQQPDEEIPLWDCEETCPVKWLGGQSGEQKSPKTYIRQAPGFNVSAYGVGIGQRVGASSLNYGDVGTAARYFKQVQAKENNMAGLPQELVDYLVTLISPPLACDPLVLVFENFEEVLWESYESSSVHGMIVVGDPEQHMKDIDRVLRPGAHLLIIAPEEDPTGHEGACAVEDFGYEIRDAITVLDTHGEFHYVAKANTSERNAGVEAWVNEQGRVVRNSHETVKPIGIMEALLQDIPKGDLVVDPFLGSGTTGISCLRLGYDFIGIERELRYLGIADQRIHHWNSMTNAWNGAVIESEAEFKEEEESVALEDLFGFGQDEETDNTFETNCPVCRERNTELEIKEQGERLEVCSFCAEDRERVRQFLITEFEQIIKDLE